MTHTPEMVRAGDSPEGDAPGDTLPLELARRGEEYLTEHDVQDGRLEAELMLAAVLGVSRLKLYLDEDVPLTADQAHRFRQMVERRAKREPLQYIVGNVAFREIEIAVDPRALIPRPETEVLVGVVLEWTGARGGVKHALDIGTGSGAIALSLIAEGGAAHVLATDLSPDALALAEENAARLGLEERVDLRIGSVYDAVESHERFDVIVSNPPYIALADAATLAPEIVDWEPEGALFAGPNGTDVLELIIRGAADRLNRPGLLALEMAPGQTQSMSELARACGFANVRIIEDLAGRARIVAAELG